VDCLHTGYQSTERATWTSVSDSSGKVNFVFQEGEGQYDAKAEECDFVFDATVANQPTDSEGVSTCMNIGTNQNTKISQICQGNAIGCSIMSNMCTLFGYSAPGKMEVAFSAGSSPNMDYGNCSPCECDPIAEIVGGTALSSSAQNQLVAISTTLGFVTLADSYFLSDQFPSSAAVSPARQALTMAIDTGTMAFDLTDSDFTLELLLSAEVFHTMNDDLGGRRKLNAQSLADLNSIFVSLNVWMEDQDSSGVDAINTANEYAGMIDDLSSDIESGTDPVDIWTETFLSGDPAAVDDYADEVRTTLPAPRPPIQVPEKSSSSDIGVVAGGAAAAVIVVAIVGYMLYKRNKSSNGSNFSATKRQDQMTSLTTVQSPDREIISMQGDSDPHFMVAEMDDNNELPSASI